jgi:hypothetical protein
MGTEPVSGARPSEIEHVEWALREMARSRQGFHRVCVSCNSRGSARKDRGDVPSGVIGVVSIFSTQALSCCI